MEMEQFLKMNFLSKMHPNNLEIEKEVDKIIESVDLNQSGLIDFTEFVTAQIQMEKILSKQKLQQAFAVFDIDKNGEISKNELEQIMGGLPISDENWKLLMNQIDSNGDGSIQFAEFINLLDSDKLFKF
eukprot:TRINITY_DN7549_c0_g1_i3.p3 TRINITY_DN7549_c0_g1~~TRINITY_DN7549_c0_g1_i3.p3  ORF type:complete len:129 (+),score=30.61 TRINITY_DN7549_c0_g1_i3:362-748(+)